MNRRTIIVEGPLAFRMTRIAAAQRAEAGLHIATLPQLAARLAGGFTRPARAQDLAPAIRGALKGGGFAELEGIRQLPGMIRSVAWTLTRVWNADLSLAERAGGSPRLADLATVESRVRANLPKGVLTPRDLRDAALRRLAHAAAILGPVEVDRVVHIAPVWRPLLEVLCRTLHVTWRNPGAIDVGWFSGKMEMDARLAPATPEIVSCANPRAEVVEALRWTRELIASGRARPEEIAICATATDDWDEQVLALATDAGLPLHFSHGVPALASREGQACAALADVLLNGLSQERVRRLVGHARGRGRGVKDLPRNWAQGLVPGAALFELHEWCRALDQAYRGRADGIEVGPLLMPVLECLAKGTDAADQAGDLLLGSAARALWTEALRRAPPQALEFSLQQLRLPDGRDPGACAVWCPASHLAAAPRSWVRLLGMTTRSWPRRGREDPLVPSHILPRDVLGPDSITAQDRRAFDVITAHAAGGCVLSRSRRNAQGALLAASPLVQQGLHTQVLKGARIPRHAFSEADRLLARPDEAATSPSLAAANSCWRNWRTSVVTAHDGRIRSDHPAIARALDEVQSATSLRLMLRDPLGFVWRYALGWRALAEDDQPLTLDSRTYGELVHELLRRTVDALEPEPGYVGATRHEIERALAVATAVVSSQWPLERSVPPLLLWRHTLDAAARLALKALTFDNGFQPGTRNWTELVFGHANGAVTVGCDLPWLPVAEVIIPGACVRIRGSIDRLDLNGARTAVRVSDYKTGIEPRQADQIVLGRGAEVQRVLYALAARQLLPGNPRIIARLVFLAEDQPRAYGLPDVDQAIADIGAVVTAARDLLRQGTALPGPDAREQWNDFRLALPASSGTYFQIKQATFSRAFGGAARVWNCR
jgi:hypothetical protein